jgi:ketosteroid isomerase-like protein
VSSRASTFPIRLLAAGVGVFLVAWLALAAPSWADSEPAAAAGLDPTVDCSAFVAPPGQQGSCDEVAAGVASTIEKSLVAQLGGDVPGMLEEFSSAVAFVFPNGDFVKGIDQDTFDHLTLTFGATGLNFAEASVSHAVIRPLTPDLAFITGHAHHVLIDAETGKRVRSEKVFAAIMRGEAAGWRVIQDALGYKTPLSAPYQPGANRVFDW